MQIAPLAVLSLGQAAACGDAVIVPRAILEALLRTSFSDLPADSLHSALCIGNESTAALLAADRAWRDEPVPVFEIGFEDDRQSRISGIEVQWFDDVAQAIADGVIDEIQPSPQMGWSR